MVPFCPFYCMVPLSKSNSAKKGTLIKGSLRNREAFIRVLIGREKGGVLGFGGWEAIPIGSLVVLFPGIPYRILNTNHKKGTT